MGQLVPIIIFVVIVINVVRRIAEYNRTRPKADADGDWTEWTAEDGNSAPGTQPPPGVRPSGTPRRTATPSDRVREILEQLAQGEAPRPPLATPVPPPLPVTRPPLPAVPTVPTVPTPPPRVRPVPAVPAARRYLPEEVPAEAPPPARAYVEAPPPSAPSLPGADSAYRESLRKAFPLAMASARETRAQGRPPFAIRLRGRRSLRQAIVLAEALGPPRAFDL